MSAITEGIGAQKTAGEATALMQRLFPLCRSITGDGLRETLRILGETVSTMHVTEVPSGTPVFDWTIPKEWRIRGAHLADESGRHIIDFRDSNLHVVGYSAPVDKRLSFAELQPHIHSLPSLPDAIPYRTSYYKENWGFCMTQKQRDRLDPQATYHAVIDSELFAGSLSIGEAKLAGTSGNEYLISTYCCHPSLANDNLSGPVVTALLYKELAKRKLRHSYRFVFIPETIGAVAYCALNPEDVRRMAGGFVVTSCGGRGQFGIKETYRGGHIIDRAARLALRDAGIDPVIYAFVPDGSDERQYSSPGFRLPVATIAKDKYYEYDYYHTSLDDLNFVSGEALAGSLQLYLDAIEILERNVTVQSLNPNCEPQLGRRGLYPQTGGGLNHPSQQRTTIENEVEAISWIMFLADGGHDLMAIAERTGFRFRDIAFVARKLADHGLLELADA